MGINSRPAAVFLTSFEALRTLRDEGPWAQREEKRSSVAKSSSPVSGVASRYAQSLFELSRDDSSIETTERELVEFERLIEESADFRRLVESPAFTSEEQLRAMTAIVAEVRPSELVGNFLKVVSANRRLFALPAIIRGFRQMAATHRGEVEADVTSAQALNDEQRRELGQVLNAYSNKTVTMRESVDPSILGGIIVRIGSRQIDTSLRTKLSSLKLALKEVG
jgi:F-type H+-transporting ATPase subunit delta